MCAVMQDRKRFLALRSRYPPADMEYTANQAAGVVGSFEIYASDRYGNLKTEGGDDIRAVWSEVPARATYGFRH